MPTDQLSVFHYVLPRLKATEYADRALSILQQIQPVSPKLLPIVLAPDMILTISGVRSFDTYIALNGLTKSDRTKLADSLEQAGLTLFSGWSEYDSSMEDTYSLINHEALDRIPEQYRLPYWVKPNSPYNLDRFIAWCSIIDQGLTDAMENHKLPTEWLEDLWWAPHNIRFGVLLGYPGEAIANLCWASTMQRRGNRQEVVSSDIAYWDAYNSTNPTFTYTPDIGNNPHIIKHQKLWSNILAHVYESPWCKSLSL